MGGNPARTGQIFSNDHPYFPSDCDHCAFKSVQLRLFTNKQKNCYQCANIIKAIKSAKLAPVIEEYERLRADENYTDVKIDRKSGGLSAVHREHNFDPTKGCFGIPRGDYERLTTDILRKNGYRVILASEQADEGVRVSDGFVNDIKMDIKAIEGTGRYTIKNKFESACKQGAECVILYFHDKHMYSEEKIRNGWHLYIGDLRSHPQIIKRIICVIGFDIVEYNP